MPFLTHSEKNALLLSTLAGLSTTLGAAAAIVRRPGPPALAFLLGLASGVMGVLAAWELWWVNAEEHGFVRVTAAVVGGAALYAWGAPRLPSLQGEGGEGGGGGGGALFFTRLFGVRLLEEGGGEGDSGGGGGGALAPPPPFRRVRSSAREKDEDAKASSTTPTPLPQPPTRPPAPAPPTPAELLRLGLTLAAVMCLHNLPEGVAVAAAANTSAGLHVALAVALHNIPEGIIISAPVFAATGSRWAALALATASGLSEPVGAAGALLAARAWDAASGGGGLSPSSPTGSAAGLLPLLLAAAGGVMGAVCVLDLIPEAARCGAPQRLVAGVVVGGGVMAGTLVAGV